MNLDKKVKKMGWKEIQLIKLATFLITLPIGAYFASWILPYWWLFILVGIIAALKPICKALK
jgi:hypothetical protein